MEPTELDEVVNRDESDHIHQGVARCAFERIPTCQ